MIDNFAILLTHGLMLIAAWRLLSRADLDDERAGGGESSRDLRGGGRPRA